jgi:hypothetical protein
MEQVDARSRGNAFSSEEHSLLDLSEVMGRTNDLLLDGTYAYANNDAALTVKTVSVPAPVSRAKQFLLTIRNPGASALTVKVVRKETLNGTLRSIDHTTGIAIAAGATIDTKINDLLMGEGVDIVISNNTLIGAAGAFTGAVRLRAF